MFTFNRVPIAGISNTARLEGMLEEAGFALIIMTAEDEQLDGTVRARENVVHEAGLFQGRLGFTKAILLLEEGCEEFSNIHGLGQLRFPKGRIDAVFEDIRKLLEREGMLAPPVTRDVSGTPEPDAWDIGLCTGAGSRGRKQPGVTGHKAAGVTWSLAVAGVGSFARVLRTPVPSNPSE
jgi:hypothetical protein